MGWLAQATTSCAQRTTASYSSAVRRRLQGPTSSSSESSDSECRQDATSSSLQRLSLQCSTLPLPEVSAMLSDERKSLAALLSTERGRPTVRRVPDVLVTSARPKCPLEPTLRAVDCRDGAVTERHTTADLLLRVGALTASALRGTATRSRSRSLLRICARSILGTRGAGGEARPSAPGDGDRLSFWFMRGDRPPRTRSDGTRARVCDASTCGRRGDTSTTDASKDGGDVLRGLLGTVAESP